MYWETHLPISLGSQMKQIEHPCRAADQVAVGWPKLWVGWYAPWSPFLINSEARSTYLSFPHAGQVYQLLLLLANVRDDSYGLIELSSTEAMSASPLPAQEGRSGGRWMVWSQAAARSQARAGGLRDLGRRGTEAHVDSTESESHSQSRSGAHTSSSSKRSAAKSAGQPTSRVSHYQRRNRGQAGQRARSRGAGLLSTPPAVDPLSQGSTRAWGWAALLLACRAGGALSVDSAWMASQGLSEVERGIVLRLLVFLSILHDICCCFLYPRGNCHSSRAVAQSSRVRILPGRTRGPRDRWQVTRVRGAPIVSTNQSGQMAGTSAT